MLPRKSSSSSAPASSKAQSPKDTSTAPSSPSSRSGSEAPCRTGRHRQKVRFADDLVQDQEPVVSPQSPRRRKPVGPVRSAPPKLVRLLWGPSNVRQRLVMNQAYEADYDTQDKALEQKKAFAKQ